MRHLQVFYSVQHLQDKYRVRLYNTVMQRNEETFDHHARLFGSNSIARILSALDYPTYSAGQRANCLGALPFWIPPTLGGVDSFVSS